MEWTSALNVRDHYLPPETLLNYLRVLELRKARIKRVQSAIGTHSGFSCGFLVLRSRGQRKKITNLPPGTHMSTARTHVNCSDRQTEMDRLRGSVGGHPGLQLSGACVFISKDCVFRLFWSFFCWRQWIGFVFGGARERRRSLFVISGTRINSRRRCIPTSLAPVRIKTKTKNTRGKCVEIDSAVLNRSQVNTNTKWSTSLLNIF